MTTVPHLINRETIVSAIVNAVISVGFFLLVFGRNGEVSAWGAASYAFDFVPQSFAIGFMAALVPALLTRKAFNSARIRSIATPAWSISAIGLRALLSGLAAMTIGSSLCAGALWLSGAETIAYWPAFAAKVLYGAVLGALMTRITLARLYAAGPVLS
jgi:hypothetical protein